MRLLSLLQVVKAEIEFEFFANEFPAVETGDCAYVRILGGSFSSQLSKPNVQIVLRAKDPATAESKAWEIYNAFKLRTNFAVGFFHVIHCAAEHSNPLFLGTDENGRALYSANFKMITEEA